MELLERATHLEALETALADAVGGAGSVALVSGEAGIGKTSLVDAFVARTGAPGTRCLRGSCDALFTPRPLGPLHDVAHAVGGRLRALALGDTRREELFGALLDELGRTRGTLLVFEDVHWADEATLDLLKFLGRRIRDTSTLLVATFRDDELPPRHPLRGVMADLPRASVRRLTLARLSEAAVAELAVRAGRSAKGLFALTSGNPFFVTEVLASDGAVPASVRDAVFARAGRLDGEARAVLDAVSLAPGRLERRLLVALLDPSPQAVEDCLAAGILEARGEGLAFRHELARRAWEDTVGGEAARSLHARILAALGEEGGTDVPRARLVHHAARAADRDTLLRVAPEAAREAARVGAHREAAAHYATAIEVADGLPEGERADLLEALALECYLTGEGGRAQRAFEEALEVRRRLGDRRRQSIALRWLARLAWFRGDEEEVHRQARAAIEVAEPEGPCPELAMAYSTRSQMCMCAEENDEAIAWGERAIALAERLGDEATMAHALNNVGCARLNRGDETGRAQLERSLAIATDRGLQDDVARGRLNLSEIAVDWRDREHAEAYLDEAIRFCVERDLDPYALCVMGARALWRLWRGAWEEASREAELVLGHPRVPRVDRIPALVVLARLRARRGDPGARPLLDEALELARPTGELHRIAPVAAARAEIEWLAGDPNAAAHEARFGYELALRRTNPWALGELAAWLWRAGEPVPEDVVAGCAPPYAATMRGAWRAAAAAWEVLGFPYERALALAEADAEAPAREALNILHELGARRTADVVAAELRDRGHRGLPRGPRATTRGNSAGLTTRQLQVLGLLAEGLSNAEIAARLFIAPKTAEHHVSAILDKLGAPTRLAAVTRARDLGVLPTS